MADGSVMRSLKILETMRDFVLSLSGPKEGFVFVFNKKWVLRKRYAYFFNVYH